MSREYSDRKKDYMRRLTEWLLNHKTVIVVGADNVGSNQMQKVRLLLRKEGHKGLVLMGKNTMARTCIRKVAEQEPKVLKLLDLVVGNIGFVFTNDDAKAVRDAVLSCKVPAAAKAGSICPVDVWVPAGPTGMDPSQTGFFQSLNIGTKIVKGAIEIVSDVHLLKPGDKVGNSEVTLLSKLNIRPFTYGLSIVKVYEDGATYDSSVLDFTDAVLLDKFFNGVSKLAAISLKIGYPTLASLPHSIARGYLHLLSISLATDYTFEQAQKFKDFLANPGAFAAAAPVAAANDAKKGDDKPAAAAAAADDEDEALDGGFSMFD